MVKLTLHQNYCNSFEKGDSCELNVSCWEIRLRASDSSTTNVPTDIGQACGTWFVGPSCHATDRPATHCYSVHFRKSVWLVLEYLNTGVENFFGVAKSALFWRFSIHYCIRISHYQWSKTQRVYWNMHIQHIEIPESVQWQGTTTDAREETCVKLTMTL